MYLNQLINQDELEQYVPVYPWLVSQQLQNRNQQVYEQFVTLEYQRFVAASVVLNQGLSVKKLGKLVNRNSESLLPETVLQSQIGQLIGPQVVSGDHTLIAIWLGKHRPEAVIECTQKFAKVLNISVSVTLYRGLQRVTEKQRSMH